tara:strand:+ start:957 stop:1190 length:234 start_codon:yes stop_codon:yes gene_type:complete
MPNALLGMSDETADIKAQLRRLVTFYGLPSPEPLPVFANPEGMLSAATLLHLLDRMEALEKRLEGTAAQDQYEAEDR